MIRPLFKEYKSKSYLASWIIQHFPLNYEEFGYLEPYVRGGSIFLNKAQSISPLGEAINDIDEGVTQIYRAIRDEPEVFTGRLRHIKYCEKTFIKNLKNSIFKDYMDHAVREFVLRRMSQGGRKRAFAPDDIQSWNNIILKLPEVIKRMKNVYVFNKPVLETIAAYDNDKVLMFVNPPLLADLVDVKENELSTNEHIKLWEMLNQFRGKVIISALPSVLYKRLYHSDHGWRCIWKKTKVKNVNMDCIWCNY